MLAQLDFPRRPRPAHPSRRGEPSGFSSRFQRSTIDPYGHVTVLAPDGTIVRTASLYGNPWTFTGRRLDGETGLMYYRNRMFDTGLGRFVGRDPIGYVGSSLNLFEYVSGKPIVFVDPNGLKLTIPYDWEHKAFVKMLNKMCPEGKWAVGFWDDQVYSTVPNFCKGRDVWVKYSEEYCEEWEYGGGDDPSTRYGGTWKRTPRPRGCDTSKHPKSCCCICEAINMDRTIELQFESRTAKHGGTTFDQDYPDIVIVIRNPWPKGYPGFGDKTQPSGRVSARQSIIMMHELCGHAITGLSELPEGDPDRYTDKDPVIQIENGIRGEHGLGVRTGEL